MYMFTKLSHSSHTSSNFHGCHHDIYVHMQKLGHEVEYEAHYQQRMELAWYKETTVIFSSLHATQHVHQPMRSACSL